MLWHFRSHGDVCFHSVKNSLTTLHGCSCSTHVDKKWGRANPRARKKLEVASFDWGRKGKKCDARKGASHQLADRCFFSNRANKNQDRRLEAAIFNKSQLFARLETLGMKKSFENFFDARLSALCQIIRTSSRAMPSILIRVCFQGARLSALGRILSC